MRSDSRAAAAAFFASLVLELGAAAVLDAPVTRVLRPRSGELRGCYDRRLLEDPLLAGKVTLELDIAPTRAADKGSHLPDK